MTQAQTRQEKEVRQGPSFPPRPSPGLILLTGALALVLLLPGVLASPQDGSQGEEIGTTNHTCDSATSVSRSTSGTLSGGSHYYRHSGSLLDPVHWIYLDNSGDVDLYVYGNSNCTNTLCSSSLGGGLTDSCRVAWTGTLYVEVRHWSGSGVDYTLTFCHSERVLGICA